MQIIYGFEAIKGALGPVAMTIGTYDGLHRGHVALIELVVERARKTGVPSLVYSFYPPPWRTLGKGDFPYLILTLRDKIDLLDGLGVDYLITEEFKPAIREMSHVDFTADVLRDRLLPREIHVGYDFHFGAGRQGDWRYLDEVLGPLGAEIRPHGALRVDGEIVGCTRIREAICARGDVEFAARLLGRHHFVSGTVVKGRGRGRTIGFPTANVTPSTELVPPAGVYAVRMQVGDDPSWRAGIANLGFRPTFAEQRFSVEVHLFDRDDDLYGERVRVAFVRRLREERKFDGPEALVEQIQRDVAAVRAMLPFPRSPQGALSWDPKPPRGSRNG